MNHVAPPDTPPSPAHPKRVITLHWLTVLSLILGVSCILLRDQIDGKALRQWLLEWHRNFGLLVLVLFFVRLAIRVRLGKLPHEASTSRFTRIAAAMNHGVLYLLLLAQPLLGWALSSANGNPVHLLGMPLPALAAPNEDLAYTLWVWHLDTAWALLCLISLHIAAALWHHFFLHDGVLRKMLPRNR